MTVICVTGMPGAGKGEVVNILRDQKGLPVVRMGDMVWEFVQAQGLPLEPKVVGEVANSERQLHGNDIWAKRCVKKVNDLLSSGHRHVIIDGVRTRSEIDTFKSSFKHDFYVIAIFASLKTRYERITARKRADDTQTREDFDKRDKRELSWGLGDVISMSDVMLINEGKLQELLSSTLKAYEDITRGK